MKRSVYRVAKTACRSSNYKARGGLGRDEGSFDSSTDVLLVSIHEGCASPPDTLIEERQSVLLILAQRDRASVVIHAVLVLSRAILARLTFARISCAVLVHTKGVGWALRWVMYASIAAISSGTLRNTPRRICLAVRSPKTRSTKLSHELLVGVKCMWTRGWRVSHRWTVGCLCVA